MASMNETSLWYMDNMTLMVTMSSLCLLGYIYSALLIAFNIKYRNLRFVKMTSPRINLIMITGSLLLYTFCILLSINPSKAGVKQMKTQIQYWVFTIGFTLLVGSMLVKGWRVYQLFNDHRKKNKSIRDGDLLVGLLVLLVFDVSLMLGWQLSDPITCDNDQPTCFSERHSTWMIILIIYKQLFLIACCVVGWCIRHICFPALDDGRSLILTSMLTVVTSGTVTTISSFYPYQSSITICLSALLTWVVTTAALSASFIQKVFVIHKTGGKEPYLSTNTKYIQHPMSNDVGEELLKILGENHSLKHQLEERDTMINHLKHALPPDVQTVISTQRGGSRYKRKPISTTKPRLLDQLCICAGRSNTTADDKVVNQADVVRRPTDLQMNRTHTQVYSAEPTVKGSPMHTRALVPQHSPINEGYHTAVTTPNMDLICSIADTYDLPSDSDTYSYISNCLMQKSFDSGGGTVESRKRMRRSQNSLCSPIPSDQVYPEPSTFKVVANNEAGGHRRHQSRKHRFKSRSLSRQTSQQKSVSVIMTESNGSTVIL